MIFTRRLISEFVDLKDISTEDIYRQLNAIGLEVDSLHTLRVPDGVVVGYVESCEKHPDADKLSVCQVKVGEESQQIVCGAKNVKAGLHVPVALEGVSLPNGITIKKAKLRGVESNGMICSSEELGLPKINDGILELDESIGELIIGEELSKNTYLNDEVFEIDLTPNRGDCLSVYGVARELSVAFDRILKPILYNQNEELTLGIGRVLQMTHEGNIDSSLLYKVVDIDSFSMPLLITLRLALSDTLRSDPLKSILEYVTYCTGVILQAYTHESFLEDAQDKKYWLYVKKDSKSGLDTVSGKERVSTIGVMQEEGSMPQSDVGTLVIEASYIPPEIVSEQVLKNKMKKDDSLFFRTSRGTSPHLQSGIDFFCDLVRRNTESTIYSGTHEYFHTRQELNISVNVDEMCAFIGHQVDKSRIVTILKKLDFEVEMAPDDGGMIVSPPVFRHDIANQQDIVEEIVRIYGVDNIPSKALEFAESYRTSPGLEEYRKKKTLRSRAVSQGFSETVHFLFDSSERCKEHGFDLIEGKKALLNPITNELDVLRPTLLLHLLESTAGNIKHGRRSTALFEIGSVYQADRSEIAKMGFVFSGAVEEEVLANRGKPQETDFYFMADRLVSIIGEFSLQPMREISNALIHPYQSADIIKDGKIIGMISKLHPTAQEVFELPASFIAEVDMDALNFGIQTAAEFSKFQSLNRDLSLVLDKELPFAKIREAVDTLELGDLQRYYPLDIFEGEGLEKGKISLTVRFEIQSREKTLEENDINALMESIMEKLKSATGAELR